MALQVKAYCVRCKKSFNSVAEKKKLSKNKRWMAIVYHSCDPTKVIYTFIKEADAAKI